MRQDLLRRAAESEQTVDVDAIVDKLVAEGMIDDTRYIESESSLNARSGIASPRPIPAPIQITTQSVRYFSKKDNFLTSAILYIIIY